MRLLLEWVRNYLDIIKNYEIITEKTVFLWLAKKYRRACGMSYVCRNNHLLNWCIDICCSRTEYTDELEELKVADWRITTKLMLLIISTHTHSTPPLNISESKSKSHCDWQSATGAHDQLFITLWQLWSCFVGSPLWRENGSVFCICCWPSPA
jgi:hypothetical protein